MIYSRALLHVATLPLLLFGCSHGQSDSQETASKPTSGNVGHKNSARLAETKNIVTLTEAAAAKVREIQAQHGAFNLRVAVQLAGSTGFMYDLKFDDKVDVDRDYLSRSHEVQVVVDRNSAIYLEGTVIDWKSEMIAGPVSCLTIPTQSKSKSSVRQAGA